jgi:aromatic-L-amino-acid decarboxylase
MLDLARLDIRYLNQGINSENMNKKEFRKHAHELVDWMADYLEGVENYPVRAQVKPGDIINQIPDSPPSKSEAFEEIFNDFKEKIIPGMTHWQHPSFFAYFPASRSEPSILAEMLTATLGAQCMMWATSPSAAELEEQMMEWLKGMLKLPETWKGVIQDTASTATLCALLTAREVKSDFKINKEGFDKNNYRVYCSEQAHSSVDKAVMMAGFGKSNLRKIEVDESFAMKADALKAAIQQDIEAGFIPVFIVGALGTTGSTAIDPIDELGEIAKRYGIWYHIDAAYAGSVFIIDEFRNQFKSLHLADSFVFNPHKWMFTNFDCTAYYVKNVNHLVNTFSLTPEYLRTPEENQVNNYKDWGIQLGRRFRSLKLWFVIRSLGVEGIQNRIAHHIELGQWFAQQIREHPDFELLAPVPLNTVCFRYNPGDLSDTELNDLNKKIMNGLNEEGKIFLTHTSLNSKFTLRMVPSQTDVEKHHVEKAWQLIQHTSSVMLKRIK